MKIRIIATGRMKTGPETELVARYLDRFARTGTAIGLSFDGVREIPESRMRLAEARQSEEAGRLESTLDDRDVLILLDERGKNLSSELFAKLLARYRDDGNGTLTFSLGGPDGHHKALRQRADLVLSFGVQTWPHQLARIMLTEQLYRAITILSGHPYHRG